MKEFTVIPDLQTPEVPQIKNIIEFINEHKDTIERFKEYAESRIDAIGLAANQCSFGEDRFMLRLCAIKDYNDSKKTCIIAIDPKITKSYGIKRTKFEGCLTWQNKVIVADRFHSVDVEFYDIHGNLMKESHSGFQSQVWQHEINHLNGIEEVVVHPRDLPEREKEDIGRNEKCPCGSEKKYKKCCIEI